MSSSPSFIQNDNIEQVARYLDEICSDPEFLCNNKETCGTNTTLYTNINNVNDICIQAKQANECEDDVKDCLVNTINLFDDTHGSITTSFINIILPIPNAYDKSANQKFLRLPALSGSKNPNSKDICKICACINRFATAPGSNTVSQMSSYTAPKGNMCQYPDTTEHYYYPISIQNINTKLNAAPVVIGKYKIINNNIIFAHSEEELLIPNLYELLIKNDISVDIATSFILNDLYKHDILKVKELNDYIASKQKLNTNLIKNGLFYKNMAFFYILFVLFIAVILIKIM